MKRTNRFFVILLALALLFCATLPAGASSEKNENVVYLVIEDYGIVTIELYEDKAPITVANFKKLVNEGFYDGLTFHRIIESFMIQGGDPLGNGRGGADKDITGEFAMNGYDTGIKHVEGTISMARSGHPYEAYHNAGYVDIPFAERAPYYNSASSQFFIVTETSQSNSASLDGNYAAFGRVTDGMDIIKEIAAVKTDESDKPLETVRITTITADYEAAKAAFDTSAALIVILIAVIGTLAVVGAVIAVTVVLATRHNKRVAAEKARASTAKKNASASKKHK